MKLFAYYTESNCKLECAWTRAAEKCGCKPWYVPSVDGEEMCFILGNLCFEQIMSKYENEEKEFDCVCPKSCEYSRYSMTLEDKVVLERLSSRRWTNKSNDDIVYKTGTDELDGSDYSGSHWYNMGKDGGI